MSTIDTLFPVQTFTTSEMAEIANAITQPALKKYLRHLASDSVRGLTLGQSKESEDAETYLRRQARVAGALEVVEMLLNIEKPVKTQES